MGQTRLADNTRRWAEMKIKPSFWPAAEKFAQRALKHKAEYLELTTRIKEETGRYVPWWAIPLIHERECKRGVDNWTCNIAQGWPYASKSKWIPKNGPFSSWQAAAVQALVREHPFFATNTNWSGGGVLSKLEEYNGLGYWKRGKTNPYLFSGTNQYTKGKFIRDGVYDPNHVDTQLGVAISLKALMAADPSIALDGNLPKQEKAPQTAEQVSTGGLFSTMLAWINTNPWFVFTWMDVLGIIAGTVVVTGVAIWAIKKWRRHYDR